MPVIIPETLPAKRTLERENIFVMGEKRATSQDIRPLKLAILNLMPTKIATETQILRLVANTALQVEVTLLHTQTHTAKNTPADHLLAHYCSINQVREQKFDGLVITGAPVEHLAFEDVNYWEELQTIFDWAETNVHSSFYICWAAQAALYHRYSIPKHPIPTKLFGVFQHHILVRHENLLLGFDDHFYAPHSRHTEVRREDIEKKPDLVLLSESDEAGVYILASKNRRRFYITGHSEYDPLTLRGEYERDCKKGLKINIPRNYFPKDDPSQEPIVQWRGHAHLLFANWLNYYVYQRTPYDIQSISGNGRT
jgi:homoserine O-succinyltransferase